MTYWLDCRESDYCTAHRVSATHPVQSSLDGVSSLTDYKSMSGWLISVYRSSQQMTTECVSVTLLSPTPTTDSGGSAMGLLRVGDLIIKQPSLITVSCLLWFSLMRFLLFGLESSAVRPLIRCRTSSLSKVCFTICHWWMKRIVSLVGTTRLRHAATSSYPADCARQLVSDISWKMRPSLRSMSFACYHSRNMSTCYVNTSTWTMEVLFQNCPPKGFWLTKFRIFKSS